MITNLQMAYALYRGTRVGLALQEALGELEEYEQISPSVKSAVLRKFDETICDKLENEVDSSLTVKAERLWSFRFCDSVWQLLLKNVEFVSSTGQPVVKVDGKVRRILSLSSQSLNDLFQVKIVACDARKLDDKR